MHRELHSFPTRRSSDLVVIDPLIVIKLLQNYTALFKKDADGSLRLTTITKFGLMFISTYAFGKQNGGFNKRADTPGTEPARCAERSLDETDHLGRDWVSRLPKQVSILRQISLRLTFIVLKKDSMTYI